MELHTCVMAVLQFILIIKLNVMIYETYTIFRFFTFYLYMFYFL